MNSDEEFDPEAFSRMIGRSKAQRPRPLDLEDLNQRLENASSPHWVSPGHFVTPERSTPESQQTRTPITPHPEEIRLGHVAWEDQARKTLEKYGCPPCCPSSFEYPYKGPLGDYEGLLGWWKSRSNIVLRGPDWVIRAQLRDWERFCLWRAARRPKRPTRLAMRTYVDEIRERRRAFGLSGEFHLECSTASQSRLQNWIEFQDFHHRVHARLVADRKDEAEIHKALLIWIEEQRKIMAAEEAQPTSSSKSAAEKRNPIEHENSRSKKKRSRPPVDKADAANMPSRGTKRNPKSDPRLDVRERGQAANPPRRNTRQRQQGPEPVPGVSKKPREESDAAPRRSTRQRQQRSVLKTSK